MIVAAVAATAGVLVGMVGVGGVLIAPALIVLGGFAPHDATAISLCWLAPCGVVALVLGRGGAEGTSSMGHGLSSSLSSGLTTRLAPGLAAGAVTGAWCARFVPGGVVLAGIGAVALLAGAWTVTASVRESRPQAARTSLHNVGGVVTGLGVGAGSAMTGTSGPALLIPVLTVLGVGSVEAIRIGQAAQILIAPVGAVGHLASDVPDTGVLAWGVALATAGMLFGVWLVRSWPQIQRPRPLGVILVATGAVILAQAL